MFEKTIKISGKPYKMRASALFKTQYTIYFDKKIENELEQIKKLIQKIKEYNLETNKNFENLSSSAKQEFLKLNDEVATIATKIAWILCKCGEKTFNMDFEDFLNTITDYDWILEVVALAGNTFCGWKLNV